MVENETLLGERWSETAHNRAHIQVNDDRRCELRAGYEEPFAMRKGGWWCVATSRRNDRPDRDGAGAAPDRKRWAGTA
jgi:hypothetical protein